MIKPRYVVRQFGGATSIKDDKPVMSRLYPFGWGHIILPWHRHRETYSITDAQAVCDWLNERDTWPEFQQQETSQC